MSCSEAARVTQEYEQAGIPWDEFEGFLIAFPKWWERQSSRIKAKARKGKKKTKEGDAAETAPPDVSLNPKADKPAKGKQGRAIRKNDKRKGPRR